MPHIAWEESADHHVAVRNDTADFYRFFDATPHALFLYECVRSTVKRHLPEEAELLRRYDRFSARVQAIADMPERTVSLLFGFLRRNSGRLSRRAREKEFAALSPEEVKEIESIYADTSAVGTDFDGP